MENTMSDMEKFEVFNSESNGMPCLPKDPTNPIIERIKVGESLPCDPSRLANESAVRFYRLSYEGSHRYKFGSDADGKPVFIEHEQESQQGIARRKRSSTYYNYCQPIIDWYIDTVFTRPIQRELSDKAYGAFQLDCDELGTPLSEEMQYAMTQAMICGEYYLVMESTLDSDVETRAQSEANGSRMFLVGFDYENIKAVRYINNKMTECLIRVDEDTARLYDQDYVWKIYLKDGKVSQVEGPIEHEYGMIPVVQVTCNALRQSFIAQIAEANKTHFNLSSVLQEELYRQTWTQWIGMGVSPEELKPMTAGGRKIFCIDKDKSTMDFKQLSAEISQADSLRTSIKECSDQIYLAAGLTKPDVQTGPESGRALIVKASEVARKARKIADYSEKAEVQLAKIYAGGMDVEIPVEINYPDEFHLEALDEELARTLLIINSTLPNVIKKEQIKTLGKFILQDNIEEYETLETELETLTASDDAKDVNDGASNSGPEDGTEDGADGGEDTSTE
jgi:hypothetical protein